ncbi:hypothetical protein [Alienimonas californiensis]|uniref:Uncharacterized protein n=1 Tax=Alienimonas californiensis TaxID=2527989 RepID=A0A517P7G1_9PLAN|nr:hypothetical protein [Alienimonas californiensis]QDT15293.1 hypothetical protein CA12_13760 [Alienimonas californiensis]
MADPASSPSPPGWKRILVTWLGVYPPLLGLVYGLDWATQRTLPADWPVMNDNGTLQLWFKLLCTTAFLVTAMHYVIMPTMNALFAPFLYPDADPAAQAERAEADAAVDRV